MDWNLCIVSIMTFQSINWSEITFKSLKTSEIIGETHAPSPYGGSHCFLLKFSWFPDKSVVGGGTKRGDVLGGIMVNHKMWFFLYFSF